MHNGISFSANDAFNPALEFGQNHLSHQERAWDDLKCCLRRQLTRLWNGVMV